MRCTWVFLALAAGLAEPAVAAAGNEAPGAGAAYRKGGSWMETLDPGDSASYRADVPHAIVNAGRGDAALFLVDIYRQSPH